tara:strand:+ start:253 stop:501 length:249 start_codon:yes stop_codon:yes gene_type:complete
MNNESTMQDWIDDFTSGNPICEAWDRKGGKKVDKSIRFCPKCNHMWESYWTPRRNEWVSYGIGSIPKIGKKRIICPKCKGKK